MHFNLRTYMSALFALKGGKADGSSFELCGTDSSDVARLHQPSLIRNVSNE